MTVMIPDRLPYGASMGEQKLFSVLQKLPDDYIVYYESVVKNRYPDFIVICPDMGLLVIEVKGWYPKDLIAGDSNDVLVKMAGKEERHKHPVRQARDYMLSLMDRCREHPDSEHLLNKTGDFQNKFIFPFGHFAILSNITSEQLKNCGNGDFTSIFPAEKVVTRDTLESWRDDSFSTDKLCETFRSFFDPFWQIKPLTESQVNTIRAIIHPEIIQTKPVIQGRKESETHEQVSLVLDLKQENHARNIGEGHRIIYGVAGSGKTVLLIAKAKLMSSQKPDSKILFLCYNVTLAAYLISVLSKCHNVNVKHFDDWAKANGVTRKMEEENEQLGDRFLAKLEKGCPDSRLYDAIMIDEAQDFEVSWFKCVLEAMKEPNDGDLIIVADGSQGLYPRRKVSWKEIGINAQGRTIYKKFDLDKNYRNSREIIELAATFANQSQEKDNDSILSLQVEPEKCLRYTEIKPVLVKSDNRKNECDKVVNLVKNFLDGHWFGQSIKALEPQDIGILHPLASKRDKPLPPKLINDLQELAPTVWLNENKHTRTKVSETGIKVQTIHSAKGLQYRAVILMWSDALPKDFGDSDEEADRRLFYVGLTRPEDFLVISASGASKFITEIENSGKVAVENINISY